MTETRTETEHRWFEYGRWFYGYGASMDPHDCGDPAQPCQTRERTVTFSDWSEWVPRAEAAP